MSAEIKFRGLNEEGDFVCGFYVQDAFDGTSRNVPHGIQKAGCYPVEIDPATLGKFTGMLDCDGVEIFDGDIVEYHPYHNCGHIQEKRVGEVRYGKTCDYDGFLNCKHYEYVVNGNSLADIADSDYKESAYCKVIGNRHQNPEVPLSYWR